MSSLYQIVIKKISNNFPCYYENRLPNEILYDIKIKKINKECGNNVSRMINEENSIEEDPYVGHVSGIKGLFQYKNYVYNNIKYYEREARQNFYNCGSINCPLVLYYLKQEVDFNEWFIKNKWLEHNKNSKIRKFAEKMLE